MAEAVSIARCAIIKDEVEGLAEWIAYHSMIGVDRFIIFDNGSRDGTRELVERLSRHVKIDLFDWCAASVSHSLEFSQVFSIFSNPEQVPIDEWPKVIQLSPQMTAYNYALQQFGSAVDWMMFIDVDEFFVPLIDNSIHAFLARFEDADIGAICLNEKYFGSAGLKEPDGRLVVERFTRCAVPNFDGHVHVKSIMRPTDVARMLIHGGKLKQGHYANDRGASIQLRHFAFTEQISMQVAQINHYSVKSWEEFQKKRKRGRVNFADDHPGKFDDMDNQYFVRQDRNEATDEQILRFLEPLRTELARILG